MSACRGRLSLPCRMPDWRRCEKRSPPSRKWRHEPAGCRTVPDLCRAEAHLALCDEPGLHQGSFPTSAATAKFALRALRRWSAATIAIVFAYLGYLYLTLPDVRQLATANPPTTAFMELRAREARAQGKEPRRVQRWVSYRRISPNLTRA